MKLFAAIQASRPCWNRVNSSVFSRMGVFSHKAASLARLILAISVWLYGLAWHIPVDAAPVSSRVQEVIVVFKTHFDIGYTDMASNVVARYRTSMIDDALKVVDQNRDLPLEQQFIWTLPGWPLSKIMEEWPGQTRDRTARLGEAFTRGRFVVHGLPFTTHTELLEPEDLVRGLRYSSALCRAMGKELPRDAKMTDVPCHSWIMPTLLKHAGIEFLHLGCNAASQSPKVPRLFWWEGADGSRLLTMYTAESYGTGLVPPKDWPYQTWLALIHTGDNHGPPTPEEVSKILKQAESALPGVRVRIGRLSDFSDGILREKADVPVVRGDMPDTWIHGPACDPAGAKIARNIRPKITMAEGLNTQARLWGLFRPEAGILIKEAFEQSLLYGEHTWGGALYWITKYSGGAQWNYGEQWRNDFNDKRFERLEGSWAEHTAYIENAGNLVEPMLQAELAALSQSVTVKGDRVLVYNPLPWRRSGIVQISSPNKIITHLSSVNTSDVIPTESCEGGFRFAARDVPAMGYKTYRVKDTDAPEMPFPGGLENAFFKVQLDPLRGCVSSLVDKRSGVELVDSSAPWGFGQYLYERFDSNNVAAFVKAYVKINADWALTELGKPNMPPASDVPYQAITPENGQVKMISSPLSRKAVFEFKKSAKLPNNVTASFILYADMPYLDIEITLHQKPADPWPEAGWICLPFNIEQPQFRLGRQASLTDPATDIVPGANRHLYGINSGVAIYHPRNQGVGFCPLDNPLVSLDTPGCWKYSYDFVPQKSHAFVNLFNNQWTTNFRLWNHGTWTFRVRIWSYDRFQSEPDLITPSFEARYPLQGVLASGNAGRLPPARRGLELSKKGVAVTAFGANPDGVGTLIGLWDYSGVKGQSIVRLPEGSKFTKAYPVDLRGRTKGKSIKITEGAFRARIEAFAPARFILE